MALNALSGDEQRVIFVRLCNVLDPGVAVAFASASSELWELTQAPRQQLQADHEAAAALGRKAGKRSCKELREAKGVVWCRKGLSSDDLALLGTLGSVLPALETLHLIEPAAGPDGVPRLAEKLGAGALPAVTFLNLINTPVGDAGASALAAALGRGALLLLRNLGLGSGWTTAACTAAAENGHLECLQVAVALDCPTTEAACEAAAANGHLDCLQFLLSKGCPCDFASVIGSAAARGHIACLEWAWGQGGSVLTIEEQHCLAMHAVIDDFYDVLKCLRLRLGCAWDKRVVYEAVKRNRMPILKFACRHGRELDYHACLIAVEKDNYGMLTWLCNQGTPLHARVLTKAIKRNSYCMVTKLMEHDCPVKLRRSARRSQRRDPGRVCGLLWWPRRVVIKRKEVGDRSVGPVEDSCGVSGVGVCVG